MSIKLGINGFGRIGRLILRNSLKNPNIEVAAINDITDAETMAYLLLYDSVHGKLDAKVEVEANAIKVDGKRIVVSSVKEPEKIGWKNLGVDIVTECTGRFRDKQSASKHLQAGALKVIISAPAKEPDMTIVMGVNSDKYDPKQHHIISNASCTTNCLAPVCKVLLQNFGIRSGLMTTIHSYTGDQRLVDSPHKDLRRARAAGLSMIPTTTGAAKAVSLVLPELSGKLNGISIRIPTPTVSIIDLSAVLEKSGITVSDINQSMLEASQTYLSGILGYTEEPLVSCDFKGSALSAIFDGLSSYTVDNMIKVFAWYDNEMGYASRMVDLAQMVGEQL